MNRMQRRICNTNMWYPVVFSPWTSYCAFPANILLCHLVIWLLHYVSLEQKAWHISSHGSMWHGCDPWLWCYWIPSPWGAPRWHANLRALLPCLHEPECEVWDGWPTFVRIHGSLLASIASYYTSSRWPFQIQEPQRLYIAILFHFHVQNFYIEWRLCFYIWG